MKGKKLEVGDHVVVRCVVRAVYALTDYCNVILETVEPMPPGEHRSSLSLNALQVRKEELPFIDWHGEDSVNSDECGE